MQGLGNSRSAVSSIVCPPHAAAAGLLLSARRAGDLDRLLPGAQQQMRAVPRCLNADSLDSLSFATTTFLRNALFDAPLRQSGTHYRKKVLSSNSLAVSKSRLKTFLFSQGFPVFLCALTRCLSSAPLKLRPYGAIQICLFLLLLLFLYPG